VLSPCRHRYRRTVHTRGAVPGNLSSAWLQLDRASAHLDGFRRCKAHKRNFQPPRNSKASIVSHVALPLSVAGGHHVAVHRPPQQILENFPPSTRDCAWNSRRSVFDATPPPSRPDFVVLLHTKDVSYLYAEMSGKGASAGEAHLPKRRAPDIGRTVRLDLVLDVQSRRQHALVSCTFQRKGSDLIQRSHSRCTEVRKNDVIGCVIPLPHRRSVNSPVFRQQHATQAFEGRKRRATEFTPVPSPLSGADVVWSD